MNELTIFNNDQFGQVRTTLIDEEPWFVAADVCEVFGDTNYRRSTQLLDEDEKGVSQMDTPGGPQEMIIINESGLYHLLFNMQPAMARGVDEEYIKERKEKLRQFKRWVTHEVLPAIRKQGYYMTPAKAAEYLGEKGILMLANTIKEDRYRQNRIAAITQSWEDSGIIRQGEKYHWEDNSGVYLNVRETAKILGVKYRVLESYLITNKIMYPNRIKIMLPCPGYDPAHFVVREHFDRDGHATSVETLTTPKGREWLRFKLDGQERKEETPIIVDFSK